MAKFSFIQSVFLLDGEDLTQVMKSSDSELVDECDPNLTRRLCFSFELYPSHMDQKLTGCRDCKFWLYLKLDLLRSVHEVVNHIAAYGGGVINSLLCSHSYRESKVLQVTDDKQNQNTTMVGNDKENRTNDGIYKPRRQNVTLWEHMCPLHFDVNLTKWISCWSWASFWQPVTSISSKVWFHYHSSINNFFH